MSTKETWQNAVLFAVFFALTLAIVIGTYYIFESQFTAYGRFAALTVLIIYCIGAGWTARETEKDQKKKKGGERVA